MTPAQRSAVAEAIATELEEMLDPLRDLVTDARDSHLHAAEARLLRMLSCAKTTAHGARIQAAKMRSAASAA